MKAQKSIPFAVAPACLLLVAGCATAPNGFSVYYKDLTGGSITNLAPYSGATRIIPVSDSTNDVTQVWRSGYVVIGEAAFEGPLQSESALMAQARKVGADVVLNWCHYLGSVVSAMPFVQYQPGQTYTTTSYGIVTGNGLGGSATYNGTSTTTTPGTFTTEVVPVTVQRYAYSAGFFRMSKPPIFGALVRQLPDDLRRRLERNTGVFVWCVRTESPAFVSNILEGDVILRIKGQDVMSVTDFYKKLQNCAGDTVEVVVWRNGETRTISASLNKPP